MEGRRKDGAEKGTQECPSMSKGSETGGDRALCFQSLDLNYMIGQGDWTNWLR
jgi:hypothetical protein